MTRGGVALPPGLRRRGGAGFGLLDVLVGLLLLAVAAGGIFAGFKGVLNAWVLARQVAGEQQNARATLDWMARRIRMAGVGYDGPRVVLADETALAVAGDFDGDGQVECHRFFLNPADQVVYTAVVEPLVDPGACTTGAAQPLSADVEANRIAVTALRFRYFDDTAGPGTELTPLPLTATQRAKVRRVRMTIEVRGGQVTGPFALSAEAVIR